MLWPKLCDTHGGELVLRWTRQLPAWGLDSTVMRMPDGRSVLQHTFGEIGLQGRHSCCLQMSYQGSRACLRLCYSTGWELVRAAASMGESYVRHVFQLRR